MSPMLAKEVFFLVTTVWFGSIVVLKLSSFLLFANLFGLLMRLFLISFAAFVINSKLFTC